MAAIAHLPAGATVDSPKDLAPFPGKKRLSCHNPNLSKGDLAMATLTEILDFDGEIIIKGRHTESLVHEVAITEPGGNKTEMPKS